MDKTIPLKDTVGTRFSMNPKKFALWVFMVSIVMMFAAFTSAYVVKQSDGEWLDFPLPMMFNYSSIVIVISSVLMQMSYYFTKKDEIKKLRITLLATAILGLVFLVLQWFSWQELIAVKAYWVGNPAGSFIYVMTGMHGLHLISALIFLLVVTLGAFNYKVHSKNMLRIEMCATYWHFLGGLWLYLYLFLTFNH